MLIDSAVSEYVSLRTAQGSTERTLEQYVRVLRLFRQFAADRGIEDTHAIDVPLLRAYLSHRLADCPRVQTGEEDRQTLSCWLDWLTQRGAVEDCHWYKRISLLCADIRKGMQWLPGHTGDATLAITEGYYRAVDVDGLKGGPDDGA